MENNIFQGLTLDQAKQKFRKLAFEYHPDQGGTNEQFNDLKNQFDDYVANYNRQQKSSGKQTVDYADIVQDILQGMPQEFIDYFTDTSIYKVATSGIISDVLGLFGSKQASKAKNVESIIKKITDR